MKLFIRLSAFLPAMVATALIVVTVGSCAFEIDHPAGKQDANTLQLSFSVPVAAGSVTKSLDDITQTGSAPFFHGMQGIRLLPFNVRQTIASGDACIGIIPQLDNLPRDDSQHTNYNFVYNKLDNVPVGTTSFLFYGYSLDNGSDTPGTAAFKMRNGSLIASGLDSRNPSGISFSPEPMWTATGYPDEATTIANYLTQIANTKYRSESYYGYPQSEGTGNTIAVEAWWDWQRKEYENDWPTTGNPNPDGGLQSLFDRFTNSGSVIGLSGVQAAAMISEIYRAMRGRSSNTTQYKAYIFGTFNDCYTDANFSTPLTCGTIHNEVRDAILRKIESWANGSNPVITLGSEQDGFPVTFVSDDLQNFPGTYGLPGGAIGIEWNNSTNKFDVVAQGTKRALQKYCYPPRLWYYANTQIQTSTESDNLSQYPDPLSKRYTAWNLVLDGYQSGTTVIPETKSVALVDPIQYGVALFSVTLKYVSSSTLPDAGGDPVNISNNKFPLTALFVGGQRQQNFDFTPVKKPDNGVDTSEDYVSYDNLLYSGAPTVFISQGNVNDENGAGTVNTLSLQTRTGEPIYIAAEFQNNSTQSFQGRDGLVVPGASFYLVGELNPSDVSTDCVFLQDHQTKAKLTISSLANALNAIPNLTEPQLDLGVKITLDWKQATTTHVPMY